jgi:hypothetical protein
VGLALDAVGNRQACYDLFVNPSGVQGDIYTTLSDGEDSAPDWVWESAGKITKEGYQVEIKLPLKSIRYRSGKTVKMGILFWRRISRLGVSGSWPELLAGESRFKVMASIALRDINASRNLEVLPSITYGSSRERVSSSVWGAFDNASEFGMDFKYGITSSITADLTVNPDYSQVESDAFQVMVNRRYPIFFSEKRPFFMESKGLFNIAGTGGDNMMYTAVHTRRIVDPAWGARLTGTAKKTTFGILTSQDQFPGQVWDDEINPNQGKSAFYTIARAKQSLGTNNYIGLILTRKDFARYYNQVIGGDIRIRLARSHILKLTYLNSFTRESEESIGRSGNLVSANYDYFTRTMGIFAAFEHFSQDFQMDTAFYNRTGFSKGTFYIGPIFVPSSKKLQWIKRINPFFFRICFA